MTYAASAAWLRERLWFGLVLGAVPWVVWVASLGIGGWYKDAEGTLVGADHLAFFTAAHLVRDGRQAEMYSYDLFPPYQKRLIGWEWDALEAYRNPPFYCLLYLPTAGLSYYTSLLAWSVIGIGLLALAIGLLRPERPGRALLWSLAFYPVFATISFGQNTLLSLAVFAAVYRLLESDRRFAAGLVAGLLWFKPQLLLGLFIWWAIEPRRYGRSWLGVGVTGLSLAALSWLVLPEASQAFVESLQRNVQFTGEKMWNKHTPKAFLEMLAPGMPAMGYWAFAAAVSAASIAVAWRIARQSGAPIAVMFPVAVFLSLWASPHALIYEWALLIAAAVVLWSRVPHRRDVWLCLYALTMAVLAISTPLSLVQEKYIGMPLEFQISVPVLGLVGGLAARELAGARMPCAQS